MSAKNNSNEKQKRIFGPIPSRRLGLSLGVDIVPFKVCPLDCVYCQLGRTTDAITKREEYVPLDEVLSELKEKLSEGIKADYVTLSGSGEPTLHSGLGVLIDSIHKITDIPVAVLTNSVLLTDPEVRADCSKADVILPSLDAADDETFTKINRPCRGINIKNVIDGLCQLRDEFTGQIWLEIFIVPMVNSSDRHIYLFKSAIERIRPDMVHLNTVARPTADMDIQKASRELLEDIQTRLPGQCEIVADFSSSQKSADIERTADDVLDMLKRRPCSLEDICSGLTLGRNEVLKYIEMLLSRGSIEQVQTGSIIFYKSI